MNALRATGATRRKNASFRAAFVAWVTALSLATACHVKLIGDYDDTIDRGISDVQQKAELYFAKLQSNPNTPYDQSFYDDMHSRLATLKTRASASYKKDILVQQILELESEFVKFQEVDQGAKRPIHPELIPPAESAINVSVESILKLELALKRGVPAAPAATSKK
jgi:hypothetical protein